MAINSIGTNTAATKVSIDAIQQERVKLCKDSSNLSEKISSINNSVKKMEKCLGAYNNNIVSNESLLKSLQSVSAKHGENSSVRLKNDRFKNAQASNFFKNILHNGRYQTEREAAVKLINAEGSTVSAGKAIKALTLKIDSDKSKVNELEAGITGHNNEINILKAEKNSIDNTIKNFVKIETDAKKAGEKNRKIRQDFSAIYQSNAGCKALNDEARHQFGNAASGGKVSGKKIVEEYSNAHGDNIFGKGNKDLAATIKANCDNLSELVKTGAEAWYTPSKNNMTTYRGQGITKSGLNTLISQFNTDRQGKTETVYKLGQFFSTSKDLNVASEFAERSQDEAKVIFKVNGNSSNGLSVPGGLTFENKESERLYSPLANFKVTAISGLESNTYLVTLKEVTKGDEAKLLPY